MSSTRPRWRPTIAAAALLVGGAACGAVDVSTEPDTRPTPIPVAPADTAAPNEDTTVTQPDTTPTSSTDPEVDVSTTSPTIEATADDTCRRLTDFDDAADPWFIVNDGVMGGRSNGSAIVGDSMLRFEGTVVTDGGGFTSVRRSLDADELAGTDRVELRVRADDRGYGLIFDDLHEIDGRTVSYRTDLDTDGVVDSDGWQVVSVSYRDLTPTIFGRVVDAGSFVPEEATEIGIIIADSVDGDFVLEIDWIDACRAG